MVLFHLIFLLCTTIRPKIRVLIDSFFYVHTYTTIRPKNVWPSFIYSFFCARPFNQDLGSSLTDLFLLFAHDHSAKTYCPLSFILVYDHSTKIRVLIDVFLLFVHDHSTKVRIGITLIFRSLCFWQ